MSNAVTLPLKDKADRLIAEGRVSHVKGHVYRVEGDHGTYTVHVSYAVEASGRCTCPRNQNRPDEPCSHLFAASVYELANPVVESFDADPFRGL